MRKLIIAALLALPVAGTAFAAPGDFDVTFGATSAGFTRTDLGANESGEDMLVDASGRVIVGGYRSQDGSTQPVLAAYLPSGQPDTTFGAFGVTGPGVIAGAAGANVAVARNAGTLYMAIVEGGTIHVFAYDDNGVAVSTFGSGGHATVPLGAQIHPVFDMQVWGGRLVLAAGATNPVTGNRDFVVARIGGNGALDPTFDGDGVLWMRKYTGAAAYNRFTRMALQPDGKLLLAGRAGVDSSSYNFVTARINGNGSVDTLFGVHGLATVDFGGSDYGRAIAVQADGRIVLGGMKCAPDGTACEVSIARLLANGALDTGYATGGRFTMMLDYGVLLAEMTLDPQGRAIAVGNMRLLDGRLSAYVLRLTTSGALDTTFGGGVVRPGYVSMAIPGAIESHLGVLPWSGDRLLLVGSVGVAGSGQDIVVSRIWN